MGFFKAFFGKLNASLLSSADDDRYGRGGNGSGEALLRERLERIMTNEFSDYDLRSNVSVSSIADMDGAADFSYGLFKDGSPVALFTIFTYRNDYRKKCYRLSRQAAEMKGIPHMCFFTHLPNEESYITERIINNLLES